MQFNSVFITPIIMKTFLIIFVLFFSSSVFADDISDFEIDGMSIGDSLLDYYSEEEIISFNKKYNSFNDRKFYSIKIELTNNKYDEYKIQMKEYDKEFTIYALHGEINYKQININERKKLKKDVVKEVENLFNNIKPYSYEFEYDFVDDGKSIAYITDFDLNGGANRIWCRDWAEVTENKKNFIDDFVISISSKEFLEWNNKNK